MERYPLSWPEGWRRIPPAQRTRARFSKQQRHYSTVPGGSSWTSSRVMTLDDARARYRALAAQNHPDRGGTHERMSEINRAWDEAQRAFP